MFDAKGIDPEKLEHEEEIHDATGAGRGYGVAGGVAEAHRKVHQRLLSGRGCLYRACGRPGRVPEDAAPSQDRQEGRLPDRGHGMSWRLRSRSRNEHPDSKATLAVKKSVKDSSKKIPPKELGEIELD